MKLKQSQTYSTTNRQGAWIFVSHSHKDLEKVRELRNELERQGANPLLFYLKCLDDDNALLPELIEGEIHSRDFFILCDSSNARQSKYVLQEIAAVLKKSLQGQSYIDSDRTLYLERLLNKLKSSSKQEDIDLEEEYSKMLHMAEILGGKNFEFINLYQEDLESQHYKIERLCKRATVFLSYAHSDRMVATKISDAVRKHDYGVWTDAELQPGEDWAAVLGAAIDKAVQHGFVLLLLSKASLQSQFCRQETIYALKRVTASGRSNVVPIIIEKFDRTALPSDLQAIQYFDLTTGPFDERIEALIDNLKTREME